HFNPTIFVGEDFLARSADDDCSLRTLHGRPGGDTGWAEGDVKWNTGKVIRVALSRTAADVGAGVILTHGGHVLHLGEHITLVHLRCIVPSQVKLVARSKGPAGAGPARHHVRSFFLLHTDPH